MKMILTLLFALLCMSSCNWIQPIHSLNQIEPGLRKHVGEPSVIDTGYRNPNDKFTYNNIEFLYEESANVSFEQAVYFFSKAFDCNPELRVLDGVRRRADFKSRPEQKPFSIMLFERIDSIGHVGGLLIFVLDLRNEIQAPSSPKSPPDSYPN